MKFLKNSLKRFKRKNKEKYKPSKKQELKTYKDVFFNPAEQRRKAEPKRRAKTKKNYLVWFQILFSNLKRRKLLLTFIFIFFGSIVFLRFSEAQSLFKISEFVYLNESEAGEANRNSLKIFFQQFEDQSTLSLDIDSISRRALNEVPFLQKIYIRKVLPDKLEIEAEFSSPSAALVTFQGFKIIDDSKNVFQNDSSVSLPLTQFELDAAQDLADFNSVFVRDAYLFSIEDEKERQEIDWEEVPDEEKKEVLEEISSSTKQRIENYQEIVINNIRLSYPAIPIYFFFSLEEVDLENDNSLDNIFQFSKTLSEDLDELNISPKLFEWSTKFTCKVILDDSTQLLFIRDYRKPYSKQIEDLEALIYNDRIEPGRIIDLRAFKIAII